MKIEYFDLISNDPIKFDGLCTFKPPKIEDIRRIGYQKYNIYCWALSLDRNKYLKEFNLFDSYYALTDEEKEKNTLYKLIRANYQVVNLFIELFNFFIVEDVLYDTENVRFAILIDKDKNKYSFIDESNFIDVINCLLQLNCMKTKEDIPLKFKNEKARLLFEQIEKGKTENKFKNNLNLDLPHIISKYCVANKNGINILNVNQLSVYMLYDQFDELRLSRDSEIQDNIYANTVSFSDLSKYDSQSWLKNNKEQTT